MSDLIRRAREALVNVTPEFVRWADKKPDDLHRGQVLLWKTKHVRLGVGMIMSGPVRSMHNGWNNTDHLLPTMTRWDGYQHIIPADLEWAPAPDWIKEKATFKLKDRWGHETTHVKESHLVRLLEVEGISLRPCPFCGGKATWESRDGFIGAMPHQENQFSAGCCMRTNFYAAPADVGALWNRRQATDRLEAQEALLREAMAVLAKAQDQSCEGFCEQLPQADTYTPDMDLDCATCFLRPTLAKLRAHLEGEKE